MVFHTAKEMSFQHLYAWLQLTIKLQLWKSFLLKGPSPAGKTFITDSFNAAHFATINGNTENLLYLLEKDNKLKNIAFDINRVRLMHLAARSGHANTVAALINIGLHVNGKMEDVSSDEEEDSDDATKWDYKYLKEKYKSFDIFEERVTPLLLAAKSGNIETAELLISEGADIHSFDDIKCSALFYACNGGQFLMTFS